MFRSLSQWYSNKFVSREPVVFIAVMFALVFIIYFFGVIIAPILSAIVIAYLLDNLIMIIRKFTKVPRSILVYIVFILFLLLLVSIIFVMIPAIISQILSLLKSAPGGISSLNESIHSLAFKYPTIFTEKRVMNFSNWISGFDWSTITSSIGSYMVKFSFSSLPILFTVILYLFLVPLMVFYFLTDKLTIISWFKGLLPEKSGALFYVWDDLNPKLGDYIKGKAIEFIVVFAFTYIGFIVFGLNYALLLALGVGLSVIVPYIGMVLVTIPVILIGAMQYGFHSTFLWMLGVYFVIQIIDGNLLVPLLFSEVLKIHPIAVIASILIFGGFWGIWGVFFAIPLALLCVSGGKMFKNQSLRKKIRNT